MARFSTGVKTSAGSTTLPVISLYNSASVVGIIREIGATNTTSTAVDIKLTTMTTQGTPGAGLVEAPQDSGQASTAQCTAFTTHSSTGPTLGNDLGYRASIGAAVGAGVIWTFGDRGLRVAAGTANGIGVIIENGTGQALQAYMVWDE